MRVERPVFVCKDFMTFFDLCRPVLPQTAVKTIKEQLERLECLCNGFLKPFCKFYVFCLMYVYCMVQISNNGLNEN